MNTILVVDDQKENHAYISRTLQPISMERIHAYTFEQCCDFLVESQPDILVLDYYLDNNKTALHVMDFCLSLDENFFQKTICIGYSSVEKKSIEIMRLTGGYALCKEVWEGKDEDLLNIVEVLLKNNI